MLVVLILLQFFFRDFLGPSVRMGCHGYLLVSPSSSCGSIFNWIVSHSSGQSNSNISSSDFTRWQSPTHSQIRAHINPIIFQALGSLSSHSLDPGISYHSPSSSQLNISICQLHLHWSLVLFRVVHSLDGGLSFPSSYNLMKMANELNWLDITQEQNWQSWSDLSTIPLSVSDVHVY